MGVSNPIGLNIAYKAPHPNAAKLMVRWIFGDEKGGSGYAPWFTPGNLPARTDIKEAAPHPFNPKLSWRVKDLNIWHLDARGVFREQINVLDFIDKQL